MINIHRHILPGKREDVVELGAPSLKGLSLPRGPLGPPEHLRNTPGTLSTEHGRTQGGGEHDCTDFAMLMGTERKSQNYKRGEPMVRIKDGQ